MLFQVRIGVNDFERAFAFHSPLKAAPGLALRLGDDARPPAGGQGPGAPRPLFLVGAPPVTSATPKTC